MSTHVDSLQPRIAAPQSALLASALHSIDDSLITVDELGIITFVNRQAEISTGFTAAEAIGQRLEHVFRVSLAFEIASDARVTMCRRDGTATLIEHSASPIIDDLGARGSIITYRDVTEKIALDADRALAARLASVATIAAGISHELNNPVASVASNLQFAASELGSLGARSPKLEDALADVVGAIADGVAGVERVKEIVKQMKIFLFADAGPSLVDVNHALRLAARLLGTEIAAAGGITEELTQVPVVLCDEGQLVQCFMNILKNATQALSRGGGAIRMRSRCEVPYVVIELEDDGVGIPPEDLGRVFEPFFTTRPPGFGVGLGLAISRSIVLRAGGLINVESRQGAERGTLVRIQLPLR